MGILNRRRGAARSNQFESAQSAEARRRSAIAQSVNQWSLEGLEQRMLLTASIATNQADYAFGATALITGSGFAPNENVQLQVTHAAGTPGSNADSQNQAWAVKANKTGKINASWVVRDPDAAGATYVVSAAGLISAQTAQTQFTDANAAVSIAPLSSFSNATPTTISGAASPKSSSYRINSVVVSIRNSATGKYWNGTAFASATERLIATTLNPASPVKGAAVAWSYSLPAGVLAEAGQYQVHARVTDSGSFKANATSAFVYQPATIAADKSDYAFGETSYISGAHFVANEIVQLQVTHAPGTPGSNSDPQNQPWQVQADAAGSLNATWLVNDPDAADAIYVLTATGLTGGEVATTSFKDGKFIDSVVVGTQSPTPISPGASATYPISFTSHGNGTNSVTLSVTSGLPTGATASFSPNPVDAALSSTLTISTTASTPTGTFTFNVRASADSTVNATGTLVVRLPSTTTLASSVNPSTYGQSVTFTATVTGTGSTPSGTVTFKDGTATLGAGTLNGSGVATLATSALNAASHSITAVYAGDTTFATSTSSAVSQTVNKAHLTVTADAKSRLYGAANPTFTATITGFVNGQNLGTSGVTGSANVTCPATSTTAVGTAVITAAQGTLTAGNYDFTTFNTGTLTITKAHLTVTAGAKNKTYDGSAFSAFTATISGFVNSETDAGLRGSGDLSGSASFSGAATTAVNAGTYAITPSAGDLSATNYDFTTFTNANLTISARAVTLAGTRVYNATAGAAAAILTVSNKVGSDTVTVSSGSATLASKNVGAESISSLGSLALGNNAAGNYTLTGATGSVTITQLAVALSGTRAYDGTTDAAAAILSITNNLDSTNLTLSGTGTLAGKDVGSQAITAGTLALGGSAASNYTLSGLSGSVSVTAVTLTASIVGNPTKTYDGNTDATLTASSFSLSGLIGSESFTVTKTTGTYNSANVAIANSVTASLAAGDFTAVGGTLASNYVLPTSASGAGQISKATRTVTLGALSATYTGNSHAATASATAVDNTTALTIGITYDGSGTAPTNAGSYAVVATINEANYQGSASDTLVIDKADAVISISPYTGTYDGTAHGISGTAVGVETSPIDLNNLLHLGATFTNVPGGTANWTFDGNSNYKSTSGSAAVTIAKETLTVQADDLAKAQGAANPTLTATISGFVNSETLGTSGVTGTPNLSTTANAASVIGVYPISVAQGDLSAGNYDFALVNGSLAVTGVQINDGNVQRSRIASVKIGFASPVASCVLDLSGPSALSNLAGVSTDGGYTFTFTFAAKLNDGRHSATFTPASGSPVAQGFTQLFGDFDGNATVTTSDWAKYVGHYGSYASMNATNAPWYTDYQWTPGSSNGTVDANDANQAKLNIGKKV